MCRFPVPFTRDEMNSLFDRDNLKEPIKLQLTQKQKTFYQFFSEDLKSRLNFEHFPKEYDPHS